MKDRETMMNLARRALAHAQAGTTDQAPSVLKLPVGTYFDQNRHAEERARIFKPYQVNEELMAATGKSSSIFLHCLPAERGKETTDGVMESPNSHIFQQAENRMHAQNAIMVWAMGAARP